MPLGSPTHGREEPRGGQLHGSDLPPESVRNGRESPLPNSANDTGTLMGMLVWSLFPAATIIWNVLLAADAVEQEPVRAVAQTAAANKRRIDLSSKTLMEWRGPGGVRQRPAPRAIPHASSHFSEVRPPVSVAQSSVVNGEAGNPSLPQRLTTG